jgi:hypothetical protein
MTNRDRYEKDLDALIESGEQLDMSIQVECYPADFMAQARGLRFSLRVQRRGALAFTKATLSLCYLEHRRDAQTDTLSHA